jgi:hypothetical protein
VNPTHGQPPQAARAAATEKIIAGLRTREPSAAMRKHRTGFSARDLKIDLERAWIRLNVQTWLRLSLAHTEKQGFLPTTDLILMRKICVCRGFKGAIFALLSVNTQFLRTILVEHKTTVYDDRLALQCLQSRLLRSVPATASTLLLDQII